SEFGQADAIFLLDEPRISKGIGNLHRNPEGLQFANNVDDAGVADVRHILLERDAEYRHDPSAAFAAQQAADAFARHAATHPVVDATTGKNHLGMIAGFFSAVGQIVGIDTDTMTADETRLERQEIPFRSSSRQYISGVYIERAKDQRQFIHEGDIEIALG